MLPGNIGTENWLHTVFKKLGRLFMLQHGPSSPNQPRLYITSPYAPWEFIKCD